MKSYSYYRTSEPNILGGYMCYDSFNKACERADLYEAYRTGRAKGSVYYRVFVNNKFKYELQIR